MPSFPSLAEGVSFFLGLYSAGCKSARFLRSNFTVRPPFKAKEKALNIALNKITGKWDNAILKDLLVELDLEGYDLSVTGSMSSGSVVSPQRSRWRPNFQRSPGRVSGGLTEFGYADPIVINSDGTIIKGHQRCTVMMDLGYTEAEVIVLDIPDKAKEKALNIALNKITGKWDNAILKDLLVELDLEGYDFSVTGFQRTEHSSVRNFFRKSTFSS